MYCSVAPGGTRRLAENSSSNSISKINNCSKQILTDLLRPDKGHLERYPIYIPHIQSKQTVSIIILLGKLSEELILDGGIERVVPRCRGT